MAERPTTRREVTRPPGLLRRMASLRWPGSTRREDPLPRHWPDDLDITIPPAPDV